MKKQIRLYALLLFTTLTFFTGYSQETEKNVLPHGPEGNNAVSVENITIQPKIVKSSIDLPDNIRKMAKQTQDDKWIDSKGKEFWICFQKNYDNVISTLIFRLFITSQFECEVTIEIPSQGYTQLVDVLPNQITTFDLPSTDLLVVNSSEVVEDKGIYISSNEEITVYGLNRMTYTTDAFLALPLDILNTNYIAISYPSLNNTNNLSQFAVVSPYDGNAITILPNAPTLSGGLVNEKIEVILNKGQVYQVQAPDGYDLTGSIIQSSVPVAVFSGNSCANVPDGYGYCDHIVEQLPPTNTWGTTFVTNPLEGRANGDTWRIIASQDNTIVNLNGANLVNLNFGDYYEFNLTLASVIESTSPVMVMQYSNGNTFDPEIADNGDPFMMLIPPMEQFMSSYTFSTPGNDFLLNYVAITIPNEGTNTVILDDQLLSSDVFTEIGTTGFSAAAVPVSDGSHHIESNNATRFGIYSYGFWDDDSYGYPGGFSLELINEGGAPRISLTSNTRLLLYENHISNESLSIEANITDETEPFVAGAYLYYKTIGENNFTSIEMINISGDNWQADIPSEDVQDPGLEFYIYATDGQLTSYLPEVNHIKNPFSISVLPNEMPVIEHEALQSAYLVADDIILTATVSDQTNYVDQVWLNYRMQGGNPAYIEAPMILDNGKYTVTIPAGTLQPGILEYYISAKDDFGMRADFGSSSDPHEIEIFEEWPIVNLIGYVKDLELTSEGILYKKALEGITLNLYNGDELISTQESGSDGLFNFTDLLYESNYRIVCTTTIDLPDKYDDFNLELEAPELNYDEEFEIVLPKSLLTQKYTLMNDLEHLEIESDLLFGVFPPIPIANSYDQDEAFIQLSNWIDDYAANYELINESIGRLLIVDQLLSGFYGDASAMSHETFVALLECIDGFFKTQKVLNHIHKAALNLAKSELTTSVINGLYVKIYGLVFKVFIETPLIGLKSAVPEPFSTMIGDATDAMISFVQTTSNRDAMEDVFQELGKDQIKNAIVTVGDEVLLSLHYVPVTQKYFDEAVEQAKAFDFAGTIELAYSKTVSKNSGDGIDSYLELSNESTSIALGRSEDLQMIGNISDKVSQITGYASVIPGMQVLKSVSMILRGLSMASYGSAAAITFVRYTKIDNELGAGLDKSMYPDGLQMQKSSVHYAEQESNKSTYDFSRLESYEIQLESSVNDYMLLVDELFTLVAEDKKDDVMVKLLQLIAAEDDLNAMLNNAQAPVWAATEVTLAADDSFENQLTEMYQTINKSQTDRIVLYTELLNYAFEDDFQQASLTNAMDSVANSLDATEKQIASLTDYIANVEVSPMIIVSKSSTEKDVVGESESFSINATVKNMGFNSVNNVTALLKVDSSATIVSEASQLIESIGVDGTLDLTWVVRQDEVLETASYYTINLSSENIKCISSGGIYLSGNTSLYLSDKDPLSTQNKMLTIFPNPSRAFVNIQIPDNEKNTGYAIKILNILGELVYMESELSDELFTFDGNSVPPGYYFVELAGTQKYHGSFIVE